MSLLELLTEKAKRQQYKQKVLAILWEGYQQIDIQSPCMACARASGVYSFLADKLQIDRPDSRWKTEIRDMLVAEGLIDPHIYQGVMWWKGVVAKDRTADLAEAQRLREWRIQYRKSQRQSP